MDAFITPRAHKPEQEMCMDALITPYSQGASMNIRKLEELRAQLVAETKRKLKAMEDMDTADSTRMKAEADYGAASEAIYSIRNEIMDYLMGEQA